MPKGVDVISIFGLDSFVFKMYFIERCYSLDRILRDAHTVFEDVVDEFSSLVKIKERFEEWKMKYPEAYREAYIGLCLPKLFNPLIRLQLLGLNPLEVII